MTMNQVHDDLGQLDCAKSPTTLSREGAAAGFFQPADLSGICQSMIIKQYTMYIVHRVGLVDFHCILTGSGPPERVLWCGGWNTKNISASNRFTGVLDG